MAAARHNPTRRALLGAAVFAPVLAVGCGAAGGGTGRGGAASAGRRWWDRALAALREAEAAVAAYRASDYLPAHEIHRAIRGRWPIPYDFAADPDARAAVRASLAEFQPFEDRLNALGSVRDAALKRLLRTPAPDLPALALKIELIVDEAVATLAGGERCLAVLKADGWRLLDLLDPSNRMFDANFGFTSHVPHGNGRLASFGPVSSTLATNGKER